LLNTALLTFVILTWGYSWVLMKIGLKYAGPFTFATWRCAIAGLAIIPFLYMKGIAFPRIEKLPDYVFVGLFQTTIMFGVMLYGMKFVTAGKSAVLLYTMPIWTILLVHYYLKEELNRSHWQGIASGCLGILCILGWDTLVHQNLLILFGESLIIIGAISWAISNIWVKKRMVNENTYMLSGLQLIIGSVGLALLAIPTEGVFNISWTAESIFAILFTAIVASTLDFTIWFYLLKNMDINTATFSSMLVPVFGLLFDWIILGTRLDIGIVIGGILILFGIYQVSRTQRRKRH
jgi:drug/metabolite transporter (DMT)-like permease